MKRTMSAVLAAAAGVTAAIALTLPATALAWDISNLPPGFVVVHSVDVGATTCAEYYTVAYVANPGASSGHLCTDSPTFQQDLDAFVDANYTAPAPTTSTLTATGAVTTVVVDPAATTTAVATDTTPVTTVTVTTTVTTTDPTVDQRLTALEQRQATDEARITALESKAGLIIGEPKNVAPFTNPVG